MPIIRPRTLLAFVTAAVTLLAGGVVAAAPAMATPAATGMAATSMASAASTTPVLTGIRTGRHGTFDRIVLDMRGHTALRITSASVRDLREAGSGHLVWLTGCVFVEVTVHGAAAHNERGQATYRGPRKFRTYDLRNVMAVALVGDFEATLSIGIGAKKKTWMRTFTLSSPSRIVIDVGH